MRDSVKFLEKQIKPFLVSKIKAFEKVEGHVIVGTGGAAGSNLENAYLTVQALAVWNDTNYWPQR